VENKHILFKNESYQIIGACMEVHNELGNGFLEKVYQEALAIEFEKSKIPYIRENKLELYYKKIQLDQYYMVDFICFDEIIIEVKAVAKLKPEHIAQTINYLKATNKKLALLVNFGESQFHFQRVVR
jgi:GxxExxY protein